MPGFSNVLKPIKRQDLLENERNGCNAFQTDAKIHFSEKNFWRLGHLKQLESSHCLRLPIKSCVRNDNNSSGSFLCNISNTRKSVSSDVQILRSGLKK